MSGNPPPPGPDPKDDVVQHIARLRATVACLEALAPFSKADRLGLLMGLFGACDETMAALIATKLGFKG